MPVACRLALLCFAAYSCVLAAAPDYLNPKLLNGSIYDKPGGRLLFTFRRTATQTGDVVYALREFRNPDGSLAAVERVQYELGRLKRFELDELQISATGQVLISPVEQGKYQTRFEYTPARDEATKRRTEALTQVPLISDTLPAFLLDHWNELNDGASVKFGYIVVPRLETIAFNLTRQSSGEFKGKKVVIIKMQPTSWAIAQFLDPLVFTIEADPPHRILQYWGRTTPKIRKGQSWRDLDALTVFNWE